MATTPSSAADADQPTVSVRRHDAVAVLCLDRPPHNLLRVADLAALADALDDAAAWARAAVVCARGRSFCAGADFRSEGSPDPTDRSAFATQTAAFYDQARRLFRSPVPLVAAVHGAAIGAGFGLALACDLRVVGPGAFFQANFVQLGIHPGFGLSCTVPRLIGPGRASELFLTGRRVGGEEAVDLRLAERLVAAGEEEAAALALATEVAAGAPLAVAAVRRTLRSELIEAVDAALDLELAEQTELAGTVDAIEGVAAMLAKRAPVFHGR
jgi:enoyl-CoA hydratase/carnithine racemase